MDAKNFLYALIVKGGIGLSTLVPVGGSAWHEVMGTPLGQTQWRVNASRLSCHLSQTIDLFGQIVFEKKSKQAEQVQFFAFQAEDKPVKGVLKAVNPFWKKKSHIMLKTVQLSRGHWLFKSHEHALTQTLLNHLKRGQAITLAYPINNGHGLRTVFVSPEQFQPSFRRYVTCLNQLLPFDKADVSQLMLYFEVDKEELSDQAKHSLLRLRDYVKADPKVAKISIHGYTDDQGRVGHNIYLSERRAKRVRQYLIKKGVPSQWIKLTWHGKSRPIDSNESAEGRLHNRRWTISLFFDEQDE